MKQTIAVFGATGAQGGSFIKAASKDKQFNIRAITRNASSDKAKALAASGCEVVSADLTDVASLKKALTGAHYVYLVTDFWQHMSAEKEIAQVKNFIAAAKECPTIVNIVWSTLQDTRKVIKASATDMPIIEADMRIPHFDGKGVADELLKAAGLPVTFMNTVFYTENLINYPPQKQPDGSMLFVYPMADKPNLMMSITDIGKAAYAIIKGGQKYKGRYIGVYGYAVTFDDIAKKLTAATGIAFKYSHVPGSVFRTFPFPGAVEFGNMMQYFSDYFDAWKGSHDLNITKELVPDLQSFDDWITEHKAHLLKLAA